MQIDGIHGEKKEYRKHSNKRQHCNYPLSAREGQLPPFSHIYLIVTIIVTQGVLGYCLIQPLLCAATFACLRLAPGALPLSQLPVKARFLSIGTVKRSVTIEDS
jgi:hypothetical protein